MARVDVSSHIGLTLFFRVYVLRMRQGVDDLIVVVVYSVDDQQHHHHCRSRLGTNLKSNPTGK